MANEEMLRPLVTGWLAKINLAIQHKKRFQEEADQCMNFFCGPAGWFWKDEYRKKYTSSGIKPKFKITISKAFEFVALFGPVLYTRNPVRSVKPYEKVEYPAEVLAESLGFTPEQLQQFQQAAQTAMQWQQAAQQGPVAPLPPQVQQMAMMQQQIDQAIQGMMTTDASETANAKVACDLVEKYLSFTPRIQPGGGLQQHSEDGITEALIKGRGLLWPAPYMVPGSQRILTGSFYDSVENLVTDPDATSFVFGETKWIARKHIDPSWEVERRFSLSKDTLKKNAQMESAEAQGARQANPRGRGERQHKNTFDLVTWWEIWSIGGTGTRMTGVAKEMETAFDEVVGDYAYVCICAGYPVPLNAPLGFQKGASDEEKQAVTEEEVREAFAWPVPFWKKRLWPCAALDFYRKPGEAWPVGPLAPGLGELTALNIIISALVSRTGSSSRDFIAVLQSQAKEIEQKLQSGEDLSIIRLNDAAHKNIQEVVSFLRQPDVSFDVWRIIEHLFQLFDKRVGLSDLLFGMQGAVASRSATDVSIRSDNLSVRPDHMAKKVEAWMSEAAEMEKLTAYWIGTDGESVKPLLGSVGAHLWDRLFVNADEEAVLWEMDCTVEANSARKPNKERDTQNLTQLVPVLMPELSKHADMTTDTSKANALIRVMGDTIDQDLSAMEMGPRMPPPPPPTAPDPVEQAQAEFEADMQRKQTGHNQELEHDEETHEQELRQDREEHAVDLAAKKAAAKVKPKPQTVGA